MDPTCLLHGEYSASYSWCTDIYVWSGWEFQDLTKIWPNFLTTHHWCLTCSQCVCSLWRVVRPWSWTQPAYCNNHWWIQCLIPSWCTDIYSGQGENFRIWPKSGLTFWPHIIDVWHVPSVYVACEGLSDLGHGPNQPTATIIGEYSASCASWCTDIYSGQGENFRIWPKSGLTFWPHIIDVWHVPSVYVACEGLSDLGHGPNQPTATIIGEYSASYHHGALIFTLVRVRISGSDQNLA